jgi:hypothetical protein
MKPPKVDGEKIHTSLSVLEHLSHTFMKDARNLKNLDEV